MARQRIRRLRSHEDEPRQPDSHEAPTSQRSHPLRAMQTTHGNQAVLRKLGRGRPVIQRLIGVGTNQVSAAQAFEHFHGDPGFAVNDAAFPTGQPAPTRLNWTRARMITEGGDITFKGKVKEKFKNEVTIYHALLGSLEHYDQGVAEGVGVGEQDTRLNGILGQANAWLREHTNERKERTRRAAIQQLVRDVQAERQRLTALPTTTASTGMMARLIELSNLGQAFPTWGALYADATTTAATAAPNAGVSISEAPQIVAVRVGGADLGFNVHHPLTVADDATNTTVYERISISDVPPAAFPGDNQLRNFEQVMVVDANAAPRVDDHHFHPKAMIANPPQAGEYKVFQTYAVGPRKRLQAPPSDSSALVDFAAYVITYRVYRGDDGMWYFLVLKQGQNSQAGVRFRYVPSRNDWILAEQIG